MQSDYIETKFTNSETKVTQIICIKSYIFHKFSGLQFGKKMLHFLELSFMSEYLKQCQNRMYEIE